MSVCQSYFFEFYANNAKHINNNTVDDNERFNYNIKFITFRSYSIII